MTCFLSLQPLVDSVKNVSCNYLQISCLASWFTRQIVVKRSYLLVSTNGLSIFTDDGLCVICDSYVRPCTLVRICDECNYGSYQGRCTICGGPGVSDAYYCKECTICEKDVCLLLMFCRVCYLLDSTPPSFYLALFPYLPFSFRFVKILEIKE